jgi:translation initiation factor 2 beta subunit (eIF-2beta)/eIF-5
MGLNHKHNERLPWLGMMMEKYYVHLPLPRCVFCNSPDLRLGGREGKSFIACPQCGADGPIGGSVFEAVDKYRTKDEGGS